MPPWCEIFSLQELAPSLRAQGSGFGASDFGMRAGGKWSGSLRFWDEDLGLGIWVLRTVFNVDCLVCIRRVDFFCKQAGGCYCCCYCFSNLRFPACGPGASDSAFLFSVFLR